MDKINIEEILKTHLDKKHPLLFHLRKNQGFNMDEFKEYVKLIVEAVIDKCADAADSVDYNERDAILQVKQMIDYE